MGLGFGVPLKGFRVEGLGLRFRILCLGFKVNRESQLPKVRVLILRLAKILHYLKVPKLWELWYIPDCR